MNIFDISKFKLDKLLKDRKQTTSGTPKLDKRGRQGKQYVVL